MCSVSWVPIDSIGCSVVSGSWNTIADLAAPHLAQLAAAQADQLAPPEAGAAGHDRGVRLQPEQAQHGHRLAAAALARDAEDLSLVDGEVDAVDDRDRPGRAGHPDPQPLHPEQLRHRRSAGSPSAPPAGRARPAGCRR